jgi:hypothetical protein
MNSFDLVLVYRLLNPLGFVAFKIVVCEAVRAGLALKEQRSSRPIFNATLRAAASWLFFRVARSTVMIQIAALRSRLEKQPTDLRRNPRDLGDGTLEKAVSSAFFYYVSVLAQFSLPKLGRLAKHQDK